MWFFFTFLEHPCKDPESAHCAWPVIDCGRYSALTSISYSSRSFHVIRLKMLSLLSWMGGGGVKRKKKNLLLAVCLLPVSEISVIGAAGVARLAVCSLLGAAPLPALLRSDLTLATSRPLSDRITAVHQRRPSRHQCWLLLPRHTFPADWAVRGWAPW